MKTLHIVVRAAAPLAAAAVLLTPAVPAAGSAGWLDNPAATAAPAFCAMAGLPYRTSAVTDARGLLEGLVKFTSSRFDAASASIGGPFVVTGSGRPATTVEMIARPVGSGFPPAGAPAVPARSRSCL